VRDLNHEKVTVY